MDQWKGHEALSKMDFTPLAFLVHSASISYVSIDPAENGARTVAPKWRGHRVT